eukprot:3095067-Rhodomonas_salina.2
MTSPRAGTQTQSRAERSRFSVALASDEQACSLSALKRELDYTKAASMFEACYPPLSTDFAAKSIRHRSAAQQVQLPASPRAKSWRSTEEEEEGKDGHDEEEGRSSDSKNSSSSSSSSINSYSINSYSSNANANAGGDAELAPMLINLVSRAYQREASEDTSFMLSMLVPLRGCLLTVCFHIEVMMCVFFHLRVLTCGVARLGFGAAPARRRFGGISPVLYYGPRNQTQDHTI